MNLVHFCFTVDLVDRQKDARKDRRGGREVSPRDPLACVILTVHVDILQAQPLLSQPSAPLDHMPIFHRDRTLPPRASCFIWVFGSNLQGIHGADAALGAEERFGAQRGVAAGMTGRAYGIPTRSFDRATRVWSNLPLDAIGQSVGRLLECARNRPDLVFFCTRVGCDLAGNRDEAIASMFVDAPANFSFAAEWRPFLEPAPANVDAPAPPRG